MPPSFEVPAQLTGVGATALGVALLRAEESRRSDRLFDDRYAAHFLEAVDPQHSPWAAASASDPDGFPALMAEQVAVRTRYLDGVLLEAAAAGCGQVVLLANGMDTRAFRLPWPPATRVYELDFADVLAFRGAVLDARGAVDRCDRVEVAADLRTDWPAALARAGFAPDRPTAWLAEGLLYALPPAAADTLLDTVTAASAPGSVLAFDHIEDSETLRNARARVSPELVRLWQGGPEGDLETWLGERGWRVAVEDTVDAAARYGRPAPPASDTRRAGTAHAWLATARLPRRG